MLLSRKRLITESFHQLIDLVVDVAQMRVDPSQRGSVVTEQNVACLFGIEHHVRKAVEQALQSRKAGPHDGIELAKLIHRRFTLLFIRQLCKGVVMERRRE